MTVRDLALDAEHARPLSELESTRAALRASPLIWHILLLPGGGFFVATGHINCHDCALCEEQGDVRWNGAAPVPWRESYHDCCDYPEDDDGEP